MRHFIDDVKGQFLSKREWTGKAAKGLTKEAGRETQDTIEQISDKLQRGEALSGEEKQVVQDLRSSTDRDWEKPQELIERHTRWGDLKEAELGKYLLALVWLSPQKAAYAAQVFGALSYVDKDDVAFHFASNATDSMLASIAARAEGRKLLGNLSRVMQKGVATRRERCESSRIERIIARVELELREREREMMQIPATPYTLNVYPEVAVADPPGAEALLKIQAQMNPGTAIGVTDLVELLVRIPEESDKRKKAGAPHLLQAMSLGGHGNPGLFQIGEDFYDPNSLRTDFGGVSVSDYVQDGAVIIFTGCDAGAEPGGMELMREFGRIVLGDKNGILRANTCPILAVLGVTTTTCDPVEFLYPGMQKRTAEDLLWETYQSAP